jgi:hypothetical protein
VEGEWYRGQPHGVCIVESEFARGVTTFTHGKEHGGPSWCEIRENGKRVSFEYLHNGDCQGIQRAYNNEESESHIAGGSGDVVKTAGWMFKIQYGEEVKV